MNACLIEQLKKARVAKKLKQSDVAKMIGVKGNTLSNYENGVSEPDIDTFCALCDIYELDPAGILGEAYGLNVQGSDFNIKPSEIDMIKEYRALDEHGQEVVNILLQKEYERCSASPVEILPFGKQYDFNIKDGRLVAEEPATYKVDSEELIDFLNDAPKLNAAHERTDVKVTDDMKKHDDDIMDDDDF